MRLDDMKRSETDILIRQSIELAAVVQQLQTTHESGQLAGDKVEWCISKLNNVITSLNTLAIKMVSDL